MRLQDGEYGIGVKCLALKRVGEKGSIMFSGHHNRSHGSHMSFGMSLAQLRLKRLRVLNKPLHHLFGVLVSGY